MIGYYTPFHILEGMTLQRNGDSWESFAYTEDVIDTRWCHLRIDKINGDHINLVILDGSGEGRLYIAYPKNITAEWFIPD